MIKRNREKKLKVQAEAIVKKLDGEYGYYAIRGNYKFLQMLFYKARLFWYKILWQQRRTQKELYKRSFWWFNSYICISETKNFAQYMNLAADCEPIIGGTRCGSPARPELRGGWRSNSPSYLYYAYFIKFQNRKLEMWKI